MSKKKMNGRLMIAFVDSNKSALGGDKKSNALLAKFDLK